MIISLTKEEIEEIEKAIERERKHGKKFRITFGGGGSEQVKDSGSIEIREETIIFDGRFTDIKYITGISVEEMNKSRKIVDFTSAR